MGARSPADEEAYTSVAADIEDSAVSPSAAVGNKGLVMRLGAITILSEADTLAGDCGEDFGVVCITISSKDNS